MSSVHSLVGRGAPAAIAIVLAGMLAAGCSTVASDDSLSGSTGTLEGTVRTDRGDPAGGVYVWIWCDESPTGGSQQYSVTTDGAGAFTIEDVELGSIHAFSRTYDICANCTPASQAPVDSRYGTYLGTVTVERNGSAPIEIEIDWIDVNPGEPAQYCDAP